MLYTSNGNNKKNVSLTMEMNNRGKVNCQSSGVLFNYVTPSLIVMILVGKDRGDPNLHYGSKNTTLWVTISNSQRVVTTPFGHYVTKKGSGRQDLRINGARN